VIVNTDHDGGSPVSKEEKKWHMFLLFSHMLHEFDRIKAAQFYRTNEHAKHGAANSIT